MSLTDAASLTDGLVSRATCRDYRGRLYTCSSNNRSGWYYWGRWVVAGVALLIFFLVLVSCCCIAKRRRRRGNKPVYGTGWMAPQGKFGNNPQNTYPMNDGHESGYGAAPGGSLPNPPPAYGAQAPQYTGTTQNPSDGYYGNQQYNNGLQQPPNSYQPDNMYPPPPGAPPPK